MQQEQYNEENYVGTEKDYSAPDFKAVAAAYGIKSSSASKMDAILGAIKSSLKSDENELVEIILTEAKNRLEPRVAIGKAMEDMYPFLESDDLNGLMIIDPL
jgi:acetolactate synthase-1/2/3 large subunit